MTNNPLSTKHRSMVLALRKDPESIRASLDVRGANLLHAAIGLAGEGLEFIMAHWQGDGETMVEEAGDILFYGTLVELELHLALEPARIDNGPEDPLELLITALNETVDLIKKRVIYEKPVPTEEIAWQLALTYRHLERVLRLINSSLAIARLANATKLEKRYPQGTFTNADAQARADKT